VKCRARLEHRKKKPVHNVAECQSDEYEDILCVSELETESVNKMDTSKEKDTQLFASMLLGRDVVKFQIDCGTICNVIPINLLNADTKLEVTKTVLFMYNKSNPRPLGQCKIKLRNPRNQKLYQLMFQVPLLGKRAIEAMKLMKVHYENIMALDTIVTSEKHTSGQWTKDRIKADYLKS